MNWTQLVNESPIAFEAFTVYRDLGSARSLAKACEKLDRPEGYVRQLETWSSDFNWVSRAKAYDAHLDDIARRERERKWKDRASSHLEDEWQARDVLLKHAKAMLELPLTDYRASDIPKFFETASKLGRKATGLEDDERHVLDVDEGRLILNTLITIIREEVKDAETLERIERRITTSLDLEEPVSTGTASPEQTET